MQRSTCLPWSQVRPRKSHWQSVFSFHVTVVVLMALAATGTLWADHLVVFPQRIELRHGSDRQPIVVSRTDEEQITSDVTLHADLEVADPRIAKVSGRHLEPLSVGETTLQVSYAGRTVSVPLVVLGVDHAPPANFDLDIVPIFTRAGCNAGDCHGASRGQDGFRLSLFGFDPAGDYYRVTREQGSRRINLGIPEHSLLLRKPTGDVAHTGGKCLDFDGASYQTLLRWLQEGAQPAEPETPEVLGIELSTDELVLQGAGSEHPLLVHASLSNGTRRDVTELAAFNVSDPVVAEIDGAVVRAVKRGTCFVSCRYGVHMVGCHVFVLPDSVTPSCPLAESNNFIDAAINAKLQKLRFAPAEICTDQEFLRRVTLDLNGRLPTAEELDQFLTSDLPDKRRQWAADLIQREEFTDLWTAYWADILLIQPSLQLEKKPTYLYYAWLRQQIAAGLPFDQLVRRLLTAQGTTFNEPETNFYAAERDTQKIAENVAQAFLGIRTQCAQCHHHPFDRWTMDDYYGFASFFRRVARKRAEDYREWIIFRTAGEVQHPVSGEVVPPKFLGGELLEDGQADRVQRVAEWITEPDNPYFAKNIANRLWSLFFGRGIVEPVDDVRISNPPVNAQLYEALAEQLVAYEFDVRRLALDFVSSDAYQRSTHHEDDATIADQFGRAQYRRIPATVLLDCISQVTEAPDVYRGVPDGGRALQAPVIEDNFFVSSFGQSTRTSVCACDRKTDPTLSQALHLLNGQATNEKIRRGGVVARWLAEGLAVEAIISRLYRRCLSREPSENELSELLQLVLEAEQEQVGLEDVFWALLNSREFLFNH